MLQPKDMPKLVNSLLHHTLTKYIRIFRQTVETLPQPLHSYDRPRQHPLREAKDKIQVGDVQVEVRNG